MLAAVINAALVLVGSVAGLLFRGRLNEKYSKAIMTGIALCVLLIGVSSALETANVLCVIICMALGIVIGEALRIEDHIDGLGERLKKRFMKDGGAGRFTEAFMTSTLLFCVGSMAIMGSMEAAINGDFSIILSKSVMDCISAVTFAAAMGVGVCFSAPAILIYQGLLTLIFMGVGPFLPDAVIAEMTAVGGLLIIGLSANMLGVTKQPIKVGNMLPAIFLPIAYIPVSGWIASLFAG